MVKKIKPRFFNIFLVLVCLAVGFVYYLPNLIIGSYAQSSPDIVYNVSAGNLDETFAYGTRIKEVLDGDIWEGDPYLWEYKRMPNLWETNIMAVALGMILRIFNIKEVDIIFSLGDFVFPLLLYLTVFYLFFNITKNKRFSVFAPLVVLLFPNLFVFKKLLTVNFYKTISFYNFFSLFETAFNYGLSRLFVPGLYIIFLFLFLLFLYKSLQGIKKKTTIWPAVLFGLSFYLYFYYWAYSFVLMVFLLGLFLLLRDKERVLMLLKIFGIGIIISIPFWIKMLYLKSFPLYIEYAARVGREIARDIRWESLGLYFLISVLIIFLIYFWIKKRQIISIFLIALLLSIIAVLNLQLITGFNIQSDHWGSRLNVYMFSFSLLIVLYLFIESIKKYFALPKFTKFFNLTLFALTVLFLMSAALAQITEAKTRGMEFVMNKDVYLAMQWLNNNTKAGEVVVTPSIYTNYIMPIITHNNVYFPPSCRSMASENEILGRFLETNSLFDVKEDYLKHHFYSRGSGRPYKPGYQFEDYGMYLFCETYNLAIRDNDSQERLPKEKANIIINLLKLYNKTESGRAIFNYKADYLFYGPEEKLMGSLKADKFNNLELIYTNNSVKIYKVEN